MIELKDKYAGERAAIYLGGPSLQASGFDFSELKSRGYVTFLESKALTPGFAARGVAPDFYLMLFPEKCTQNSVQNFVYRSFLARFNLKRYLSEAYQPVLADMRDNFDNYFETWRPQKGDHKKYRWKKDVFLKDSPLDLLRKFPTTRVIANRELVEKYVPNYKVPNPFHYYVQDNTSPSGGAFDLDSYYHPQEKGGILTLGDNLFYNSAAIALYPLLKYLGFREVYFLGMDMSMLGSLELASLWSFRSQLRFWWFFKRTNYVFNPDYRMNRPYFLRPPHEFEDLGRLLNREDIRFTRVYDPYPYAAVIPQIPSISTEEFLKR